MFKIQVYYPNKTVKTYFGELVKATAQGTFFSITGFIDNIGFYKTITARSLILSGIPFSAIELTDSEFENVKSGIKDDDSVL